MNNNSCGSIIPSVIGSPKSIKKPDLDNIFVLNGN